MEDDVVFWLEKCFDIFSIAAYKQDTSNKNEQ